MMSSTVDHIERLKKQLNDNIRYRNFLPVNKYTVTAISFLKSSNQPSTITYKSEVDFS